MIDGQGNPNDPFFGEYIGVLYSLSYAVRMSHKAGFAPQDYFEYTVYPLEGVWDITEEAKQDFSKLDKDTLVFTLMIRQPGFVTDSLFRKALEHTKRKKPHELLDQVRFEKLKEGRCVQMMHHGSYDEEPASFQQMKEFCTENGLTRASQKHREIYISDPRKVPAEKMRTVLRLQTK